jgi:hypothetical protein
LKEIDGQGGMWLITDFLPYVSNGLIRLFLLGILPMDMEVDILHNNNMLQDLLQICKFI